MKSKPLVCGLILATLGGLVAHTLLAANGSKGKRIVYEARVPLGGAGEGVCLFSIEIEPILFHIAMVQNKYKTFRINIRNTGQRSLKLSLEKDSVQILVGSRTVNGILNLSGEDSAWWDRLEADLRKALVYPDQEAIEGGEEENVFVFVPIADLPTFPEEIRFTVESLAAQPVSIQRHRARAAS